MLTAAQVAEYRERGYIVVPDVLTPQEVDRIREVIDEFVERSRSIDANDGVFDLEPSHTRDQPRLRRIISPHAHHPVFGELTGHPRILDAIEPLIGHHIRFQTSKLNLKVSGGGAAVEWHQDFAFYPHTNDDLCAVGIYLDDADLGNGCMLIVPGSHRGPIYDHHQDGWFVGAVAEDCPVIADAAPVEVPAGGLSIHHVRALHGSAPNRSGRQRRLLLHQYTAADAYPLVWAAGHTAQTLDEYDKWIVRGRSPRAARCADLGVGLPLPNYQDDQGTIYRVQEQLKQRRF